MTTTFQLLRIVTVIALVCISAALATPRGRVPLALRGVLKILRRDHALENVPPDVRVSVGKRVASFLCFVAALILVMI